MDKETLLTGLKKRLGEPTANGFLGNTGITERTLDKYVEAILPALKPDETPDEDFYNRHAEVAKSMGGQMRFEQAEFIKSYKPNANQTSKKEPLDEGNKLIEELKNRLDILEKEQKSKEKDLLGERMRSSMRGKSGELKVSNKNLWDDSVNSVVLEEGMAEEDFEKKAKELYESRLKRYSGDGAVPYSSGDGFSGGGESAKSLDDFFKRKADEGKFPKKEQ